jgi:hypothetical protein
VSVERYEMATMVECLDCDDLETKSSREVNCVGVESAVPSRWLVDLDHRLRVRKHSRTERSDPRCLTGLEVYCVQHNSIMRTGLRAW